MSRRTIVCSRYVPFLTLIGLVGLLIASGPRVTAQSGPPATAVLTRWDIFAATGGSSTASTNATQNPNGIVRNPIDGTIWFTAQRPTLRLGRLNPATNSYTEWNPLVTSGVPAGVTLHPSSGDVWMTSGDDPEVLMKIGGTNTFRRFELPVVGTVTFTKTHRLAVTADGSAAYVPIPVNGALSGIIRVTRGASDLGVPRGTPVSVPAEHWRLPNQLDNPRHVTLDGNGIIWFTNARDNTLYRLDPATNQSKRWTLGSGTAAGGIHITNGTDGFAQKVCVAAEGNPASSTGVVQCMNTAVNGAGGNDFTVYVRPTGQLLAFPQQVAANAAGELFLTEKNNDSLTFVDDTGLTATTVTVISRVPTVAALTKTTPSVTTSDPADVTPITMTVPPTTTVVAGVETPTGHVRFTLPVHLPVVGSLLNRNPRPIGLTAVVEGAPGAPGAVFVAESFDVTNAEQRMGAVISRVAPGESATIIQATAPSLTFTLDVGATSPATQMVALEKVGGGALAWSATKTQPWLTLAPSSGTTPSTLDVTVTAGTLAAGTYQDTITVTGGSSPTLVPVTFHVVQRPTIVVAPSSLHFTGVAGSSPPAPQTFAISSQGVGTLEWTATVNVPGVSALLEVPGQGQATSISGTGPAVVTVHIGSVPSGAGLVEGAVTITSTNASNSGVTVEIDYDVTVIPQLLLVSQDSLVFDAVLGGAAPAAQVVNVINGGPNIVTWGVVFPYTSAGPLPSWLHVTPEFAPADVKQSIPMTVSVDTSSLAVGTHTATITVDDHTGGAAPATVGVLVTVRAAVIEFAEEALTFPTNTESDPSSQPVTLTNPGNASFVFTPNVTTFTGGGWLSVTPAGEQTIAAGGSLPFTVTVDPEGLAPGTYTGQILVASPSATNGSDAVIVTMVVADATPPVIGDVVNATAEATGSAGAAVSYTLPTATDAHDGVRAVSCTPAPGTTFALGATTVTCTASDAANNTASATLTVTVHDTTPPAFSGVADVTVQATHVSGAAVTFTTPTATDLVDGLRPVTCTPAPGSTFPVGDTTVTCTASDTRGNSASTTFTVTVTPPADTTPPAVTVPGNMTVEAEGPSGTAVTFAASASDVVSGALTPVCTPPSGSTFALGLTSVTCTATDATGNAGSASFTITVVDTTPPEITGATPITLQATDDSGAVVTFAPTASDLVSGTRTVTCTPMSGSTFPVGETTVDCSSSDAAGNTATASFLVTVTPPPDTTPPSVTVPANMTVEAEGQSGTAVTFAASAVDDVSGALTPSCVPPSGSTFPLGTTTVVCTATDGANNTGSASFTIAVVDTTPPVISGAAPITLQATNASGAVVTFALTAVDLVSGDRAVTCTPESGSTFPVGGTTVTCSSSDAAGNTATDGFLVTVTPPPDTAPPTVTVPANMIVEAEGPSGAAVTFTATASDVVSGPLIPTCTPPSGSTFALGDTTVTCTATDAANNTGSASFTLTVRDTTPPLVTPPPNQTVTSAGPVAVTYPAATATDLVSAVTLTYSHASGSTFPLGATTVTVTATDEAGNEATATFTVTVNEPADTTPPVISAPASQVLEATSPAGAVATFVATATDNSGAAPTITYSPASGSTFPLGVTTVTVTARDAAGNEATAPFTITVRDTIAPALQNVPASFTVQTNQNAAIVTYTMPTAIDTADATPTVVCTPPPGTSLPANATHTITCTATDDSGNVSTGSFQVTVQQSTPYLLIPDDLHFRAPRQASCNGQPVGPSWRTKGIIVINKTSSHLPYTVTNATSWVKVLPASGTIPGSFGTILIVSVNIAGLGHGIHQGSFTFTAGGVSTVVPVTLEIGNAKPTLCLTPSNIVWGTVGKHVTLTQVFNVLNVGDEPLGSWTSSKQITDGTLALTPTHGTGPTQVLVTVKTGKKKGSQSAQVTIKAPGAENDRQTVDLRWTVH